MPPALTMSPHLSGSPLQLLLPPHCAHPGNVLPQSVGSMDGQQGCILVACLEACMHVLVWWAAQVTLHKPHRSISEKAQAYVYFACCSPLQHFASSQLLRGGCCCSLRHARSTWKHVKPTLCCDGAYACAQQGQRQKRPHCLTVPRSMPLQGRKPAWQGAHCAKDVF